MPPKNGFPFSPEVILGGFLFELLDRDVGEAQNIFALAE
jgi:hypothetical protein